MSGAATATALRAVPKWSELRPTADERLAPVPIHERQRVARAARQTKEQAKLVITRGPRDALLTFALYTTMLFILTLGTIGAALFVAFAFAYAFVRRDKLGRIFATRGLLLVAPAFAVLSTLWSESPNDTLKYSLELVLTIALALILSAATRPKSVLIGMFYAFGIYVLVALGFGQNVYMGVSGTAFGGLTGSKNLLADIASTGLMISLAVFLKGIADRKPREFGWALFFAAVEVVTLVQARSAGALIGLGFGVAALGALLSLRASARAVRATVIAFFALFLVLAASFAQVVLDFAIDAGTRYFDKDPTLTGRSYLWQRAADLIAEKPLLGKGFHAFWLIGNPDAEGMWRYTGVSEGSGFSFHNTAVELIVHIGWIGLFIVGMTFVLGVGFLVARFVRKPDFFHCFWLAMLAYQMSRLPIENVGFTEFYYSTVMMFCAFGYAFGPVFARYRLPTFAPRDRTRSNARPLKVRPPGFRYSDACEAQSVATKA